jgi:tetratricopeptide (TPR) repeat protein
VKPVCGRHPENPAHWLCPKCRTLFCSGCVITLDSSTIGGKQVVRFCPQCMIAVRPTGAADVATPFWKRLFSASKPAPATGTVSGHSGKAETACNAPESIILKQIDEFCLSNKHETAINHLRQWIENNRKLTAALAGRYADLLIETGKTEELRRRAAQILPLIIAAGDARRVIALFDGCGIMENDLINPDLLMKMGEMLSANGRGKDAIRIYSILTKNRPRGPETPLAYFKAARTYNEGLMAPEKAKKILTQLIQKYPRHAMLPAFKSYLEKIGR